MALMQGKVEVAIEARQATEALITAHSPYRLVGVKIIFTCNCFKLFGRKTGEAIKQ
jgi:hypothetical protein